MTKRILIAEPSPTLTTLIRLTLNGADVTLDFVTDGHAALSRAQSTHPALIIADASLPQLDGYALTAALRRDPVLATVPVLLTMADYEVPNLERMTLAGVSDVLTKPFERQALLERVRSLLAEHEERPTSVALPSPSEAVLEPRPAQMSEDAIDALFERLQSRLEAVLDAKVQEAVGRVLETVAAPTLASAMDKAIADALPDVLAAAREGLGPHTEALLAKLLPELIQEDVQRMVLNVVPELSEGLIKDEISRLLEETDA